MKRFLKILGLLTITLLLVASGVNTALDRMTHQPDQSTVVFYNNQCVPLLVYNGDVAAAKTWNLSPRDIVPALRGHSGVIPPA